MIKYWVKKRENKLVVDYHPAPIIKKSWVSMKVDVQL